MPRLPADPEGFIRANTALEAPDMVPEFKLWLASEYVPIWQATEAWLEEQNVDPPYWAFCWPGGQAIARYLLDHPETVRGRRVLDLACGSGLAAVAAAKAGAVAVTAVDVDAGALAAVKDNAEANAVRIETVERDILPESIPGVDVVLAGDVFYSKAMADRVDAFLRRAMRAGTRVLVGDPEQVFDDCAALVAVVAEQHGSCARMLMRSGVPIC